MGEGRVATGQEMVREKQNSSRSGKTDILKKSQGKLNYNFIHH